MLENAKSSRAVGYLIDSPTFRSSWKWGQKLGMDKEQMEVGKRTRQFRKRLDRHNCSNKGLGNLFRTS